MTAAEPTFEETYLAVAEDVFDGSIGDLAAVEDPGGYVSDDAGDYLFGLSSDFRVLVVKLHPTERRPATYAVLPGDVDWAGFEPDEDDESGGGFGGAFSYVDGGAPRVFFAASNGDGFFEVVLPIEIPDDCWFADADADFCDDADDVDVARRGDADASDDGDGLNCPAFDLFDTSAPTAAPSPEACDADVCWADGSVAPLDCGAAEGPLRASAAGVSELQFYDEAYGTLFGIDYVVESAVGAALFDGGSAGYVPFAVLDGRLCRFDGDGSVCFDGDDASGAAGAAVVGTTYYYAKDQRFYYVEDIHTDAPIFHASTAFAVDDDLFDVRDFAAVVESDETTLVNDGDAGGAYLLGLGADFQVLIVRLDAAGAPADYAVVPGTVDGTGAAFGAAHAYADESGETRAVFVDDGGLGAYEVRLPITVGFDCWNDGTNNHEACDSSTATVERRGAAAAASGDGLNCPDADFGDFFVTKPPTAAPTRTDRPTATPCDGVVCWADLSVASLDCSTTNAPLQVWKASDATSYGVGQIDVATGTLDLLYELTFVEDKINAVGLFYDVDAALYVPFGVMDERLCRFDAAHAVCFGGDLAYPSCGGPTTPARTRRPSPRGRSRTRTRRRRPAGTPP